MLPRIIILAGLFLAVFYLISCSGKTDGFRELSVTRSAEWGSVAGKPGPDTHAIKFITIHHSGEIFLPGKDVAAYLRNLQEWSRSEKNWVDIPYHFLIDPQGGIYEGRDLKFPGDTNTNYDPTGHLLICVLGNYEEQKINSRQLAALKRMIIFFALKYEVGIDNIRTHKDYTETACPGKDLYKYLHEGSLYRELAAALKKKN